MFFAKNPLNNQEIGHYLQKNYVHSTSLNFNGLALEISKSFIYIKQHVINLQMKLVLLFSFIEKYDTIVYQQVKINKFL